MRLLVGSFYFYAVVRRAPFLSYKWIYVTVDSDGNILPPGERLFCLTSGYTLQYLQMEIAYRRAPRAIGGILRAAERDETCGDRRKRNHTAACPRRAQWC